MTTVAAKPVKLLDARPGAARPGGGFGVAIDPIKVARRYWPLVVAMGVVGAGTGFALFQVADRYMPRYTGTVSFEIMPRVTDPLAPAGGERETGDSVVRAARTETAYITSPELIRRTLTENREVRDETAWARGFVDESGGFAIDEAVRALRSSLSSIVGRDSNIFAIEWSAEQPRDVPVVLNALAKSYLAFRNAREEERFDQNLRRYQTSVEDYDKRISTAQSQLESFIRDNNLTDLDNARNTQLRDAASDLLRQINDSVAAEGMAESVRRQTEQKLAGIAEFNQEDRRLAESDPNIRGMKSRVNSVRVAVTSAREKFSAEHMEMQHLERELRSAESEYEIAVRERIRQNLEAQMRDAILSAERQVKLRKDLEQQYEIQTAGLRDMQALIAEYQSLRRVLERLEAERVDLQKFIRDLQLLKSREDAQRVRVAFPAETPREKSFPKRTVFLALGLLAGIGLTAGGIFLREFLDQRVKSGSDLALVPGARILGTIPDLSEDPTNCERAEMIVSERPQSVLAESFRQASVPLGESVAANESKILLVVGGLPGAGTTTVVTNLACVDAAAGRRVLVVDANFRRPALARILGLPEDGRGLGDVLAGEATAAEVATEAPNGLFVVTAGTPATRIFERLHTSRMDALLAELRPQYDHIYIDAPPAVVAGEALVLARKADASILVVRANQEQRGLVARLIRQLGELRSAFLGVVLNRPRRTAGGYFHKNYAAIAEYSKPV